MIDKTWEQSLKTNNNLFFFSLFKAFRQLRGLKKKENGKSTIYSGQTEAEVIWEFKQGKICEHWKTTPFKANVVMLSRLKMIGI